jgi:hypothetical protein
MDNFVAAERIHRDRLYRFLLPFRKSAKKGSFDALGAFPTAIDFTWNFGDGGTASGPVVCHQFDDFGTFTVSVLARDGDRNCGQQTQVSSGGHRAELCSIVCQGALIIPSSE